MFVCQELDDGRVGVYQGMSVYLNEYGIGAGLSPLTLKKKRNSYMPDDEIVIISAFAWQIFTGIALLVGKWRGTV